MKDAETVTFAGGSLDRASHLRSRPEELREAYLRPETRCLPVWQNKLLMNTSGTLGLGWLPTESPVFSSTDEPPIFLGLENGAPCFALRIPDWDDTTAADTVSFVDRTRQSHPDLSENLVFGDLRSVMAELSPVDAGNAAAARGIYAWHETHGFCANCGAASVMDDAGWRRTCPECGKQHFPRTDPVVIMLITYGNSVLVGRSPAWPEGMYSLLAGFMEPGESIEAAVRRETWEEAGVPVGEVRYLSSQPWPFPSSLMIGCHGDALATGITLDPVELEDARWISREQALASINGRSPGIRAARQGSIARFIIERWLSDSLD